MGCTGTEHNGPQDALRHTIWNVLMAQRIGADEAKQFADAHESGSTVPEETAMDLWNNTVGRALGAANPGADVKELVKQACNTGQLRVLRTSGSGPVPSGTPLIPSGGGPGAPQPADPGVHYNGAPGNPYPPTYAYPPGAPYNRYPYF